MRYTVKPRLLFLFLFRDGPRWLIWRINYISDKLFGLLRLDLGNGSWNLPFLYYMQISEFPLTEEIYSATKPFGSEDNNDIWATLRGSIEHGSFTIPSKSRATGRAGRRTGGRPAEKAVSGWLDRDSSLSV